MKPVASLGFRPGPFLGSETDRENGERSPNFSVEWSPDPTRVCSTWWTDLQVYAGAKAPNKPGQSKQARYARYEPPEWPCTSHREVGGQLEDQGPPPQVGEKDF